MTIDTTKGKYMQKITVLMYNSNVLGHDDPSMHK
jgi:hypothetical protein